MNAENLENLWSWADLGYVEAYPPPLHRQSRGGFEFDDRQIRLPFEKGDQQLKHDAVFSPGFDGVGSGVEAKTDVHGNTSAQSLMRTELVIPGEVQREDPAHVIGILGDSDLAGTFLLERAYEAFKNGDATVLADGPESLMDVSEFLGTPGFEVRGDEWPLCGAQHNGHYVEPRVVLS